MGYDMEEYFQGPNLQYSIDPNVSAYFIQGVEATDY
jgi:hypothetical protein